jgi:hypothetical protein
MNALAEHIQGDIGQETLTQIVSRDELVPQRKRHPWVDTHTVSFRRPYEAGMSILRITFCKLIGDLWVDLLPVGRWIRSKFGRRHLVTATFMNHAVVNDNHIVRKKLRSWR